MKVKNFIKINKPIIITFLVFEVFLYGGFYLNLKSELSELTIMESRFQDFSEVNINSRKALEIVKNEHDNAKYGNIREIKYTHDYETYNGRFYAIVKTDKEEYCIYEVWENMGCTFLMAMNGDHSVSYETWQSLFYNEANFYDIYHDYLGNVSEWKAAEID